VRRARCRSLLAAAGGGGGGYSGPPPDLYLDYASFAAGAVPDASGNAHHATAAGIVVHPTDGPGGLPCAKHNNTTGGARSYCYVSSANLGALGRHANGTWWHSGWIKVPAQYTQAYNTIMGGLPGSSIAQAMSVLSVQGFTFGASWGEGDFGARGNVTPVNSYVVWHNFQYGVRAAPTPGQYEFTHARDGVIIVRERASLASITAQYGRPSGGRLELGGREGESDRGGDFWRAADALIDGVSVTDDDIAAIYAAGLAGVSLV
jgi:hypothetical protein